MQIIADENIPLVSEAFSPHGNLRLMAGRDITPDAVQNADVLLVRSVTKVHEALLERSKIRFVATATAGFDHIDTDYLQSRNIGFASAPASNAESVVEYVLAALLHLSAHRNEPLRGKTVGIVGYGNIGSRLAPRLAAFGMDVLVNDPPLFMDDEPSFPNPSIKRQDLDSLLSLSDILTFHVPLTHDGTFPTFHLLNAQNLPQLKQDVWLLNASRGGVIDENALGENRAKLGGLVLDVWAHEPCVSPQTHQLAQLATPHIAGYSYDAKCLGTQMIYEAFCAFFQFPANTSAVFSTNDTSIPLQADWHVQADWHGDETLFLHALVKQMYDIERDNRAFLPIASMSEADQAVFFHRLRKEYPRRFAFSRHSLAASDVPAEWQNAVTAGLRIRLRPM